MYHPEQLQLEDPWNNLPEKILKLLLSWHYLVICYTVKPNSILLFATEDQNQRISYCMEYNLIDLAMMSIEALPIGKGVTCTM